MKNKGFTIIEMLVAIAILMIVMLVSVPTLTSIIQGFNQKQAIGNLQTLVAAENTYFSLYNSYPSSLSVLSTCGSKASSTAPCLVSSSLTSSDPLSGYVVSSVDSSTGYFLSLNPMNYASGTMHYCAETSITESDGLIRGTADSAPTKDSCLTKQVVSNSGQGPAGPPGPVNVVTFNSSGAVIASGETQQLTFTVPSGQYAVVMRVNYTFGNQVVTKEWISCTLGNGTAQLDSAYNQHTYVSEQYSGGYVPLVGTTVPDTTTVFIFCTNNGSSAPINWGVVGTATQLTAVSAAH